MPYKIHYLNAFKNDIKIFKNNQKLTAELQNIILEIVATPHNGELLRGSWLGFLKVGFGNKPQYRVVYAIYDCCNKDDKDNETLDKACEYTDGNATDCIGLIDFVRVETRESFSNLYSKNKKYTDNYRR